MYLSHYPEPEGSEHAKCGDCGLLLSRDDDSQPFTDVSWDAECYPGHAHTPTEVTVATPREGR